MKHLSHSYKIQTRLCYAIEILLVFIMLSLPLVCLYLLFLSSGIYQSLPEDVEIISWTSGDNILFIIDNFVIFLVLLQMYFFCKGIRLGELFTKERIKNVKCIGLILVIGYIINLSIRTFWISSTDVWNAWDTNYLLKLSDELYNIQQLLLGGGLLSLSYIFDKGRELKEENELII